MPVIGKQPVGTVACMAGIRSVDVEFFWAWSQMVQYNQEVWLQDAHASLIHYDRATFSDHAPARNSLARNMKGDWLVQFDTDHVFEPDIVRRIVTLADECQVDVVSALYQFKNEPFGPVAWMRNDNSDQVIPLGNWDRKVGLMEVGSVGGGCLFVRRSVFDRIAKEHPDKHEPFTRFIGVSEDHSFCRRCRDLGIKIYLAPHIECNHLRTVPVRLEDMCVEKSMLSKPQIKEGFV